MKRILRALACTGILGTLAAAAQAQSFVVGVRVPVRPAAVVVMAPPCPGPGYVWTDGYYAGAVWVPGRWAFHGPDARVYAFRGNRDRAYDRGYDRGFDRGYDRSVNHGYDRRDDRRGH